MGICFLSLMDASASVHACLCICVMWYVRMCLS